MKDYFDPYEFKISSPADHKAVYRNPHPSWKDADPAVLPAYVINKAFLEQHGDLRRIVVQVTTRIQFDDARLQKILCDALNAVSRLEFENTQ